MIEQLFLNHKWNPNKYSFSLFIPLFLSLSLSLSLSLPLSLSLCLSQTGHVSNDKEDVVHILQSFSLVPYPRHTLVFFTRCLNIHGTHVIPNDASNNNFVYFLFRILK